MKTKTILLIAFVLALFFAKATTVSSFGTTSADSSVKIDLIITGAALPENCSWAFIPISHTIPVSFGNISMITNNVSFIAEGLLPAMEYDVHLMFEDGSEAWFSAQTTNTITTGVSKISVDATSINLYGKTLQVTILDESVGKMLTVYNILGQPVITETLTQTTEQIDAQKLSAGVYVVSVNGVTKKIEVL